MLVELERVQKFGLLQTNFPIRRAKAIFGRPRLSSAGGIKCRWRSDQQSAVGISSAHSHQCFDFRFGSTAAHHPALVTQVFSIRRYCTRVLRVFANA
jgi:hypothetical protein